MVREATETNIAAFRKRREEREKKFTKRESLLGKKSRKKAAEGKREREKFAAQQAEVERKAAAAKKPAPKPKVDLVKAGQIPQPKTLDPFTTPAEEKPKGFQNVIDVLGIALNPLSEDKIIATTGSKIYNTAAEYVANAPYVSALMLTGIGKLATGAVQFALGKVPTLGTGATVNFFAKNTKTSALSTGMLANVAASKKWTVLKYAAIAGTIGTYPWAEWALGEAKEGMIFNVEKATRTGDIEIIKETIRTSEEIFDITGWETVQRLIPYTNIAFSFGQKAKALQAQWKINDKILKDEIIKIETGETDDAKWERIRTEEAEQEKAAVDYYNEQRKQMFKWEQEAKAAARKSQRKEERKAREEDAQFWAAEAAKQRELEAEDRQAIADFWTAYRKTTQKIAENSRPSNLNFGLL